METSPQVLDLLERVARAARPYEFRTFVIGFERPEAYDRAAHEESFRKLKIVLGEGLKRRFPGTDAEFLRPELRLDVGADLVVRAESSPLFFAGRYRKLSREIPSTRWVHHACRGRGCAACGFSGDLCGPSIQQLLSGAILEMSGGERTLFHGLGREDTDARMLGPGRPFVLEVHHPRKRTLGLPSALEAFKERARTLADVVSLVPVDREAVAAVKSSSAEKTYRAWIEARGPVPPDALPRVRALAGAGVEQVSPERVQHRKGRGVLRLKRIIESEWLGEVHGLLVWETRVESGTYVKELVSGDSGRTRPSIAQVLGVPCSCAALDVLDVHWKPPWEE
ncbi:MAG TPA: tRNA pseudouridine(54/55) synthase Pus10 [Planctomycetota bacterium]|nr:tRNA pseudouridine(54/55) synthase Pus10 [Planctomycetota bacterium]